jgi:signal transduction histidine kinase
MNETNAHKESTKAAQRSQTPTALNAEWLASLSHELRSPLTAIQGYASILLRHKDRISADERQEFLQAISQGSNRIASVLDRFLDIANLEAGTTPFHPLPVDMEQLVRDVLLAARQDCPDGNLSLTLKQGSDHTAPLDKHSFVFNGDDTLIRKMLMQLLENAQKYSANCAPIQVTLSCYTLNQYVTHIPPAIRAQLSGQHQRVLELSIQDHGIGIAVTDLERIFERFERVDMQLTRAVSGLGLGLTMCKYIVALHHGAIWAESTLGEGSTFYVLLPAEYDYT